jgi:hypothetical protein
VIPPTASTRPVPLGAVLGITFLGSMSGGAFWAGLFFVTAGAYQFSPTRNLVLAAVLSALSAVAARLSGRIAARSSPRGVLRAAFATWAVVAVLPVMAPRAEVVLWVSAVVGSVASAIIWPIVESYVSAGRHGSHMRAAIGWFNVTWTPAAAVPLFVMPAFARVGLAWTLALGGLLNLVAIGVTVTLPRSPGAHHPEDARAAIGAEYPWLARTSSWLLPASYVISTALLPILPFRLAAVGAGARASTIAALWMAARFVTFFVMWRTGFWHGRWGTLLAGVAGLLGGMTAVLLAPSLVGVMGGLAVFGVGMGLTYYAALYYSLSVGHAAVEAGGTFEALIGVGSCVGPVLGLGGHALWGAERAADATTVALALAVFAAASPGLLRPYAEARRDRRTRAASRALRR